MSDRPLLPLAGKRILLIIGGGIAAYKALDLIRRLQDLGAAVRGILTKGGQQFITPLSVASLSGDQCYTELFSLKDEAEMGHIRLSREADLVVVVPATADLIAKIANGHADDLASTTLLATDKPVMIAPAMNVQMWAHASVRRNVERLVADGVQMIAPGSGDMACGEVGAGRLAEVPDIVMAVRRALAPRAQPLAGRRILVTAGPTHEPIDPVRYLANRSSGKQGYAIAGALAALGANTVMVTGPTHLGTPPGVTRIDVETACEMYQACQQALPVDAAICVAAVADWRVKGVGAQKLKKSVHGLPTIQLTENPDILKSLSQPGPGRPALVIGFAAETETVEAHAQAKRARKGCDWIVANDVSGDVMGGELNQVILFDETGAHAWPQDSKEGIARRLAERIAAHLSEQ
ncbi:MAG: bifunctional phosphopantothenoylcysteine decarboxylase/phosphopantothenate--cysteine ligase CoaBC [Rhodothalassiaceae bacterium]